MRVALDIDAATDLIDAMEKTPGMVSRHLKIAMLNSLEDFKERMVDAAPRAQTRAEYESAPIDVPGGVSRSTSHAIHQSVDTESVGGLSGRVYVDGTMAPHAVYVVTGRDKLFIKPRQKEALRWVDPSTGRFSFSRGHWVDAVEPNDFPARALESGWIPHQMRINRAIRTAIREAQT